MMAIKQVNYYEALGHMTGMRKPGKVQRLLEEFVSSGYACVEVENLHYKNINAARTSFINATKRDDLTHIKICTRNNRLYLINTLLVDKKILE